MLTGVVVAFLASLCGLAVCRVLRGPISLVPFGGLAAMAVLTTWCAAAGVPPVLSTGLVVLLAMVGVGVAINTLRRTGLQKVDPVAGGVLLAAVLVPWLLLGVALVGVDAPVSTHDGAFHVEVVDSLRRGVPVQGWYPMGFHTTIAAVLRLMPWLDTARGTVEAAQALAFLAPLGIFALGLAIGLSPRLASLGALIQALTYIYPYDDHLWGGWPLAMSILLMLGLWSVAARWLVEPRAGLAVLAGLLAGAIVLTHGTEVYSSAIGLAVIALVRWRRIRLDRLVRCAPLALAAAALCAAPYLSSLVVWAAGGGASVVGEASLVDAAAQGQATGSGGGDWLEFVLGITGASSLIDLPLRLALLAIGARFRPLRLALVGWIVFGALLFAVSFLDVEPVRRLYVVTFPWLVHHRPPQMVVLFTSLLVGGGMYCVVRSFWSLRPRLAASTGAWRRLALVSAALLFFFAEGSAVSIYKTLQQVVSEHNVFSADDRAAMSWLRQNAVPGAMVINNAAADAGIWAPYKTGLPILLPRSAPGPVQETRAPIAADVLTLDKTPSVAAVACSLGADYVYEGSRAVPDDVTVLPDRAQLEQASGLQQVFASGDAAVYRLQLPCS